MKTNYQIAKSELKKVADYFKKSNDFPMRRQIINDTCDSICRARYHGLSEYQKRLLHNYACTLHPKD